MTATDQAVSAPQTAPPDRPAPGQSFWRGRSGLLVPAILAVFSLFLLLGSLLMDAGGTEFPGPRFVPVGVGAAGLVIAILLAVDLIRVPQWVEETSGRRYRTYTDFGALAWVAGGFFAFAVLLPWLGWILAAALLFWCTARGFGSQRPLFDIVVALLLSSAVFLLFGRGLDLNLPSGLLGGGF
jgi:putative tricarboxylic transport membrane protein